MIADVVYFVLDMVRRRQVRPKWENLVFVAISLAMFAIAAVVPYAGGADDRDAGHIAIFLLYDASLTKDEHFR